jgi:nucleotide-binding universal stress UspA family protein
MTRVMIAIDGSDLDTRLAETALGLFGPDAEYWAVNVQNSLDTTPVGVHPTVPGMYAGSLVGYGVAYPFTPPQPHDAAVVDDDLDARREASAHEAAVSAGIDDAAVIAESGDPPTAILSAADRHGADVIVVGSRDRSWWSKLIEPSVSGDVIEASPVPVLVISEAA